MADSFSLPEGGKTGKGRGNVQIKVRGPFTHEILPLACERAMKSHLRKLNYLVMKRLLATASAAVILVLGCTPNARTGRDTIQYVKQIATDSSGVFDLVKLYRNTASRGSIAIIGEPSDCIPVADRFASADDVDNIDGRPRPDRLPDFSGETIQVYLDDFNAPYAHFLEGTSPDSADSLRTLAVENAIAAIDSAAYSSATGGSRIPKLRAKVIVLASALSAEYGQFDIDTLFRMAGCEPLIVSKPEAMFREAFVQGKKDLVVWAPEDVNASLTYQSVFDRVKPEGATLSVITPSGAIDIRTELRDLLRKYLSGHPSGKLEAILLDDYGARTDLLRSELEHIRMEVTEEDMRFNKALSGTFIFIEPARAETSACYSLLRSENLFTHNIAYPRLRYFQSEESLDGQFVYVEIGREYYQSRYVQRND